MKPFRFAALPLLLLLLASCTVPPEPVKETEPPASVPVTSPMTEEQTAPQTAPALPPPEETPSMTFGMTREEADAQLAPLLEGLFTGESEEKPCGERIGRSFSFRSPDFVFVDGQFYAYYTATAATGGHEGIGLATTTDGLTFTDRGCVIGAGAEYDENGASSPSVWRDADGHFTLVYECRDGEGKERLALASSEDGVSWKKEGVLLSPDPSLPWQKAGIGAPDLYREGKTWYLLFRGYDHTLCQTGLASGTDLTALSPSASPVLPCAEGTVYSGTTGRGDLLRAGDWYYRVYEVSTGQTGRGFAGAEWTHLFARSKDLVHWEISPAPPLSSGHSGYGYDCPCFLAVGGRLYVYYRSGGASARAEIVRKGE